ncbi:MAG: hypothetical protein K8U03_19185 [Planctomycetia bacterium]|nr:hypothetical protein [Planctomycetia bacterium]
MSSTEMSSMHNDHREWKSENALWHDQLREWEAEIAEAIGDVAKVEQALHAHESRLRTHAAAIRLYEQGPAEHELAELVQEGASMAACCTANKHKNESLKQTEQRQVHEALKRTHHALMARWSLLLKALGTSET